MAAHPDRPETPCVTDPVTARGAPQVGADGAQPRGDGVGSTPTAAAPALACVTDPVTAQQAARPFDSGAHERHPRDVHRGREGLGASATAIDADLPCVSDRVTATRRCVHCGTPFVPVRSDQRHCKPRCRQRAYLARRALAGVDPLARAPRADTIYECPECLARYLGEQRCEECNRFCRRIGPGGACPHCDEPVALVDLIDPGTP